MSIEAIFRAGDDALQNHFQINITPLSLFNNADPLSLRTTDVDIPGFEVGTYTVDYKSQTFTKPSGKITTPNEFSFTIRLDKYWVLYEALYAWYSFIADNETGAMAEDVGAIGGNSDIRTDVSVLPIDSNGVLTGRGWKMHKAYPTSIPGFSFSQASGEPITINVTMNMLKMTLNP